MIVDQQRLMLKGRISEMEDRLRDLEALIGAAVDSIGNDLFIPVHGVRGLKMAAFRVTAQQLLEQHAEYLRVEAELAALRERLG